MLKKLIAFSISFLLIFEQAGFAQVVPQAFVPGYLQGLLPADHFRPMHMRYFSFDPSAETFEVLLDRGDVRDANPQGIEKTSKKLFEYFQIGLALPNSTFWVNLRPDASNDIIDPLLAKTDLGKVLLEADLQLKKDLASFTSPDLPEGKNYWNQMYAKAENLFGASDDMSIPALSRPWIVPGEVIIAETPSGAYIYKATLKVMLEEDYLKDSVQFSFDDERLKTLNDHSIDLIKQLIIPKLTREINSSKRYADLRQVYYSLIMAQYFKSKLKGQAAKFGAEEKSLISRIDSKDLSGLTSQQPWSPDTYFKAYQKSFQQGEYNKQDSIYTPFGMTIRTYCTGGFNMAPLKASLVVIQSAAGLVVSKSEQLVRIAGGIKEGVFEFISNSEFIRDERGEWFPPQMQNDPYRDLQRLFTTPDFQKAIGDVVQILAIEGHESKFTLHEDGSATEVEEGEATYAGAGFVSKTVHTMPKRQNTSLSPKVLDIHSHPVTAATGNVHLSPLPSEQDMEYYEDTKTRFALIVWGAAGMGWYATLVDNSKITAEEYRELMKRQGTEQTLYALIDKNAARVFELVPESNEYGYGPEFKRGELGFGMKEIASQEKLSGLNAVHMIYRGFNSHPEIIEKRQAAREAKLEARFFKRFAAMSDEEIAFRAKWPDLENLLREYNEEDMYLFGPDVPKRNYDVVMLDRIMREVKSLRALRQVMLLRGGENGHDFGEQISKADQLISEGETMLGEANEESMSTRDGGTNGQMKKIGRGMDEDIQRDLTGREMEFQTAWLHNMETRDNVRIVRADLGEGVGAYHFRNENGVLFIVLNSRSGSNPQIQEEGFFHEQREAFWISKGFSPRVAHIIASAEQTQRFSQAGGLTPYHQRQLEMMKQNRQELKELKQEYQQGRQYQRDVLEKVVREHPDDVQFALEAALRYEEEIFEAVSSLLKLELYDADKLEKNTQRLLSLNREVRDKLSDVLDQIKTSGVLDKEDSRLNFIRVNNKLDDVVVFSVGEGYQSFQFLVYCDENGSPGEIFVFIVRPYAQDEIYVRLEEQETQGKIKRIISNHLPAMRQVLESRGFGDKDILSPQAGATQEYIKQNPFLQYLLGANTPGLSLSPDVRLVTTNRVGTGGLFVHPVRVAFARNAFVHELLHDVDRNFKGSGRQRFIAYLKEKRPDLYEWASKKWSGYSVILEDEIVTSLLESLTTSFPRILDSRDVEELVDAGMLADWMRPSVIGYTKTKVDYSYYVYLAVYLSKRGYRETAGFALLDLANDALFKQGVSGDARDKKINAALQEALDPNLAAAPADTVPHGVANQAVKEGLPFDLGLDRRNISRYENGHGIPVVPIEDLYSKTGQYAHIGLGQKYGRPVIYIDMDYAGNEKVLKHEMDEIERWEKELGPEGLGLKPEEMREWILSNIEVAKELAIRFHNAAESLPGVDTGEHFDPLDEIEELQGDHAANSLTRFLDLIGKKTLEYSTRLKTDEYYLRKAEEVIASDYALYADADTFAGLVVVDQEGRIVADAMHNKGVKPTGTGRGFFTDLPAWAGQLSQYQYKAEVTSLSDYEQVMISESGPYTVVVLYRADINIAAAPGLSSWEHATTDPQQHDPDKFAYIIRASQGSSLVAMRDMFLLGEGIEADNSRNISLTREPDRISEKTVMSASLINQDKTGTWGPCGLILKVPKENIIMMSERDMGSPFYEGPEWVKQQLQKQYRDIYTPEMLLTMTGIDDYNEIVITGTNPFNPELKVSIAGVFVKMLPDGRPEAQGEEAQIAQRLKDLARSRGLPVIEIKSKMPDYRDSSLEFDRGFQNEMWMASNKGGARYVVSLENDGKISATKYRYMGKQIDPMTVQEVESFIQDVERYLRANPDKQEALDMYKQIAPVLKEEFGFKTEKKTGGIDFRALPFNVQPQAVLSGSAAALAALKQLAQQSQMNDLDKEWQEIQKQCCGEQVPYSRIKEFVAVCDSRGNNQSRLDSVADALAQILRAEEDCAAATDARLTELLVLLNSLETV